LRHLSSPSALISLYPENFTTQCLVSADKNDMIAGYEPLGRRATTRGVVVAAVAGKGVTDFSANPGQNQRKEPDRAINWLTHFWLAHWRPGGIFAADLLQKQQG
jgi:hypothetical protein